MLVPCPFILKENGRVAFIFFFLRESCNTIGTLEL